jgi:hypothetical protein
VSDDGLARGDLPVPPTDGAARRQLRRREPDVAADLLDAGVTPQRTVVLNFDDG